MELKTKIKRRLIALNEFLLNKKSRKLACKKLVEYLFDMYYEKKPKIKKIGIEALINPSTRVQMSPMRPIDGNMSVQEVLILSLLIKSYDPKTILEVGTFNGLTTHHMALNSSDKTKIHTLDLGNQISFSQKNFWDEDLKFISFEKKKQKVYELSLEKNKIQEHVGNSLDYDFSQFQEPNFIFIDGGHSYQIVANDTCKSINILSSKGIIVWHDYSCHCEGVYRFLNELSLTLPLEHIEGTSLVIYKKN
jgi:predicted O-methyltransferase YrrM